LHSRASDEAPDAVSGGLVLPGLAGHRKSIPDPSPRYLVLAQGLVLSVGRMLNVGEGIGRE